MSVAFSRMYRSNEYSYRDQYEVFNNPNASDPTHSLLAKDHFGVILNEPAGELAKVRCELGRLYRP
jgi:hypothetical protein